MAQETLRAHSMPELQLRHELKNRFPELTSSTVVKVMRLYNNDAQKCIQALQYEQENQRSVFNMSTNSHPPPPPPHHQHNNNVNNNTASANNFSRAMNNQPAWTIGAGNFVPGGGAGVQRYQEVPVKHETTHISTIKHTVAPPIVPPKPLPPKPDNVFAHPVMPPMAPRPTLVIDPANRGDPRPYMAPTQPPDFSSFLETARKQTEIPNIRCAPLTSEGGGSPESRRPVKVINVQGHTGGTVMSGAGVSPTSAYSSPRFRVVLGDGGGVCSTPTTSTTAPSPGVSPYRFTSQTFVHPQTRVQEAGGRHSSSIYIDPAVNPRLSNMHESPSDPKLSAHAFRSSAQFMEAQQTHGSNPAPRTMQPLTVSLSSHAVGPGPTEQGPSLAYAFTGAYTQGFSSVSDGSRFLMAGNRYSQEAASPSPPLTYQVSLASGMGHLNLGPGSVQAATSPSSGGMFAMSPMLVTKPPRLQHQPSTGSSTSRSNSMDSEHSCHQDMGLDPGFPLSQQHRLVGLPLGPGSSPVSSASHSSMGSEASVRDRDFNSLPRRRSGSLQEEAAYTQALLVHQRQRMDKLTEDIESKRRSLDHLRQEVSNAEKSKIMENSLRTTFPTADDISRLCESNRRLQTDIQMYLNEIDMYKNGQTPFSVIDPMGQQNFFNNMPTGPNDLFTRPPLPRPRTPPPSPPPRPPPPRLPPVPPVQRVNSNDLSTPVPAPTTNTQGGGSADSEEGERWSCSACTFANHPALEKCEICEMPRMLPGVGQSDSGTSTPQSSSSMLHHRP